MIIPSIDISEGRTVQLIGGKELALEAGDPKPIARKFRLAGEIAVIDLDAARNIGANFDWIRPLLEVADCRVGGGIRSVEQALDWLDAGAAKVILGTAASPEILKQLPRERTMAALDALHGEVVVDGWQTRTGRGLLEQIAELRPHVGGFLVTMVEREGRLQGFDLVGARKVIAAASPVRVTIAGGVTTAEDVAALDRMGADAQVGMALYTGKLTLADSLAALMSSDRPDGLWPTVVCDESGRALGLCWSNRESLHLAMETCSGVYYSRKRGIWHKGQTSGATQELFRVDLDCDRDCLRFTVRQKGKGFCHLETATCWGSHRGLPSIFDRLSQLKIAPQSGSYTTRLLGDPELLRAKLLEEAAELADAEGSADVAAELADVLYFAAVAAVRSGVDLVTAEQLLDQRARRVRRRPGNAKIKGSQSA